MFLGKIFMVYFWGYVGVTFLECLKNPIYFVKIIIIMVIAYLISHFINKKFNIK
jgi:peptidoglycan/LPS O-acetylase OafA/YrhL